MKHFLKFLKKRNRQNTTGATGQNSKAPRFTIALCGNPNSGKTTLFNLLTGSNQKVGNWPGVTVEQKIGVLKNSDVQIVDTPGVYSLSPFTPDEQVTRNFLLRGNPDLIINVVDTTALERSLFLTSQLAELNVPLVVALNMQDEARAKGIFANKNKLESFFGCKFFEISAAKNLGVAEMAAYCASRRHFPESKRFSYTADVESALQRQREPECKTNAAMKTEVAFERRSKTSDFCATATSGKLTSDALAATIAEQRYERISQIVAQCTRKLPAANNKLQRITQKIDSVVLNKWLAFPIFAIVLALVFYLSVGGLGGWLTSLINNRFTPWLQNGVNNALEQCAPWLRSLVCDGIICGVMSVLGFLPQITLLFGFIAVLEASGYMSRIAFITDNLLRKIGLGGRSFVSMILGCGCSVPAIMATRTIKNPAERNATVTLTPFMPCSAKLAIISYFTSSLLGGNALFAVSFYFVSILAVIFGGLALKFFRRNKQNAGDAFLMELPTYRVPKLSNVAKQMWERGKAFLVKAGTIIFTASVVLWILQNFNFRLQAVSENNSILASIGKFVAPIFAPLGFGDGGCGWQFSVASLTGIASKETVFETLQILLGEKVQNSISPLGAYSFTVYNILTVPCIAAVSASFSEQGKKGGAFAVAFQIVCAYVVSLVIYQTGKFAERHPSVFATAICCVVLAVAMGIAFSHLAKRKGCRNCACNNCPYHNCAKCKK